MSSPQKIIYSKDTANYGCGIKAVLQLWQQVSCCVPRTVNKRQQYNDAPAGSDTCDTSRYRRPLAGGQTHSTFWPSNSSGATSDRPFFESETATATSITTNTSMFSAAYEDGDSLSMSASVQLAATHSPSLSEFEDDQHSPMCQQQVEQQLLMLQQEIQQQLKSQEEQQQPVAQRFPVMSTIVESGPVPLVNQQGQQQPEVDISSKPSTFSGDIHTSISSASELGQYDHQDHKSIESLDSEQQNRKLLHLHCIEPSVAPAEQQHCQQHDVLLTTCGKQQVALLREQQAWQERICRKQRFLRLQQQQQQQHQQGREQVQTKGRSGNVGHGDALFPCTDVWTTFEQQQICQDVQRCNDSSIAVGTTASFLAPVAATSAAAPPPPLPVQSMIADVQMAEVSLQAMQLLQLVEDRSGAASAAQVKSRLACQLRYDY
jgi:hypothetical protein